MPCICPLRAAPRPRKSAWPSLTVGVVACVPLLAVAATVAEMAKETGCTSRPQPIAGAAMYKCETHSGVAFFNADSYGASEPPRRGTGNGAPAASARTTPSTGFPRVDPETQKGRDDVRRRVLRDELSAEEKLLAEARTTYADGAPAALPEERSNTDKYRERIARLRQAVALHERNVEALKKEISGLR